MNKSIDFDTVTRSRIVDNGEGGLVVVSVTEPVQNNYMKAPSRWMGPATNTLSERLAAAHKRNLEEARRRKPPVKPALSRNEARLAAAHARMTEETRARQKSN